MRKRRHILFSAVIGIVLLLWTLIPIYHMVIMALTPVSESFAGRVWPEHPTLDNFAVTLTQGHHFLRNFWQQMFNSAFVAITVAVFVLAIGALTSFSISRLRVRGGRFVAELALLTYLIVVYGPGRESGLSAGPTLACRAAARREPYVIPFTGSSDLLYVDDVACAFEVALQARPAGAHVFNLLGQVATVDKVIREIRRCVPEAALTSEGPTLPINAHLAVDTLADILPGLQHTGLSEGVAATVAYYRGESGLKR
ncbi:hypothetical protein CDEF62S_02782 [Castellaniella defragrans]